MKADDQNISVKFNDLNCNLNNKKCSKNINHDDYIPIKDFQAEHLPRRFHRDKDVYDSIIHLSNLTVKLNVQRLNPTRPEPINVYDLNKGLKGSGKIKECLNDQSGNEIVVVTANHLVYDEVEAAQTECVLFFDKEEYEPKILTNGRFIDADIKNDICIIAFKVSDVDIVKLIENSLMEFKGLSCKLELKYSQAKDNDKLCAIVSHPHGCAKHVTLGTWQKHGDGYYTYSAKTCPSCSGGSIFLLGKGLCNVVHRGVNHTGENCSSVDAISSQTEIIKTDNGS